MHLTKKSVCCLIWFPFKNVQLQFAPGLVERVSENSRVMQGLIEPESEIIRVLRELNLTRIGEPSDSVWGLIEPESGTFGFYKN